VDKPSPSQKAPDEERVEEDVSSQKAQDKESVEENVSIDEMFESLKFELDNMKTKFSTVKQNEELHNTLRAVEDLLRNFNERILAEADTNKSETKGLELQNQKSREELVGLQKASDKPSPSQEAPDKVVEKDEPVDEKLERLKSEIDNMKAKFSSWKKNEGLWNMLGAQLEDVLQISNTKSLDEDDKHKVSKEELLDSVVNAIHKRIKDSTKKLGVSQSDEVVDNSSSQAKASKPVQHPTLSLLSQNNDVNLVLKRFQASYDALNLHSKLCCLSLSVFPENVVIRKRHIINWWIGEGFVKDTTEKTAEEEGEDVFDELLNSYLIVSHGNSKCPIVNKFKISPWIRHMLVSSVLLGENNQPFEKISQVITSSHHNNSPAYLVLDQKKVKISGEFDDKFDHWRSVFNVGASYLNVEPQWMTKMKKMVVLQLGRWHESPFHHIEVDSINFMKDLKGQKHLKYLSLRGISRITELPPSIAQLVSLQILDLKACHNLETLPVEIALLKKLTHLDASQCYLLESMPKGIEKLSELQVLKGFVVGNSNKSPRISDLAELKKLKRLSIHIGSEAVVQAEDFDSLKDLEEVKCLKISWGVSSNLRSMHNVISLPPRLEKLDLQCFPRKEINIPPLHTLRKLYIKGGKLTSFPFYMFRKVEILRLKYLNDMDVKPKDLPQIFPSLQYAEGKQVSKQSFEWPNSVEDQVIKC
ncbi:disease resistance RPP13-like protein 4, partial [Cajanus cajan]|uniref:disease resistance RPP13-like protein 4 n=1 Tax=Cajanus cajan TaxID=3821 RepID=UPI0010FB597A